MTTHTRTEYAACCCAETIDDIRALEGFYEAALHDRDEMAGRLNQAAADLKALKADHEAAKGERDELANALAAALAERDRARDIAARLEAELARGFRIAAPDITLTRAVDPIARHGCRRSGVVAVSAPDSLVAPLLMAGQVPLPDVAVPGPSGAPGRPGSENTPSGPESPSA